jgi:RNA polymerase sigma-70 factor (ECF subfamily)
MDSTREIERLYQQHGAALVLFGTAIVGEPSMAQDAVQQVFLRLIQTDSIHRASDPIAYLFASVRNQLLNETRVRQRSVSLDPDAAWFDPPERDYAAEGNLRRALAEVVIDQRQVIVLHIWAELTFSQIGNVLEINANTAASRYRYGIEMLREIMSSREKPNVNR